jgi:Ser/Thr protein kinase RdoA (MazF antagonist)
LSGGYENDVLRIATSHGRFAVRVCAPWIEPERVASEHAILSFIADRISEIHGAVPASDGSTWFLHEGRVVCLFPFFQGQALSRDDDALRRRGAELLARIHRAGLDYTGEVALPPLAELDWDRNPLWDLGRVRKAIADLGGLESEIAQNFAAAADRIEAEQRWARERLKSLRAVTGVVQGDYWPGNLLAHHGRITAVLDWLESRRDALVLELGRAAWEFCSDRDDHKLLHDRAREFVDAYRGAGGPVPTDEDDILVDAMRIHVLGDMLRDLTYTDPEEAAAYHLGSLRRLDHLAETTAL